MHISKLYAHVSYVILNYSAHGGQMLCVRVCVHERETVLRELATV